MSHERWRSVGTVVEGGEVHVLQQKVSAERYDGPNSAVPHRTNEHRLVPLRSLEGVRSNDADVEGVDRVE